MQYNRTTLLSSSDLDWTGCGEQLALGGDAVLLVVLYQVIERGEGMRCTIELKPPPTTTLCVDTKVLHCAMALQGEGKFTNAVLARTNEKAIEGHSLQSFFSHIS